MIVNQKPKIFYSNILTLSIIKIIKNIIKTMAVLKKINYENMKVDDSY